MAVAQRMYARALFQASLGADRLEAVSTDLAALATTLDDVPGLRAFLRNPQIEPDGKAEVLGQITAGAGLEIPLASIVKGILTSLYPGVLRTVLSVGSAGFLAPT